MGCLDKLGQQNNTDFLDIWMIHDILILVNSSPSQQPTPKLKASKRKNSSCKFRIMMADDSSPEILVDCCEKHTTTVDMKETDHQQQTTQQVNQFNKKKCHLAPHNYS